LADSADALGGAHTRERLFEILKDSRIGTFGAAALFLSLLARVALLARLGPLALWALPLASAAARVGPIWQLAVLPYVTDPARAKHENVASAGPLQALVATSWCGAACCAAFVYQTATLARLATLCAVLLAVVVLTSFRYLRRASGITGDFLGATEQLSEIAALSVLAWN
jgi:adenosylcobinamide-GDP ribazoletransferase